MSTEKQKNIIARAQDIILFILVDVYMVEHFEILEIYIKFNYAILLGRKKYTISGRKRKDERKICTVDCCWLNQLV